MSPHRVRSFESSNQISPRRTASVETPHPTAISTEVMPWRTRIRNCLCQGDKRDFLTPAPMPPLARPRRARFRSAALGEQGQGCHGLLAPPDLSKRPPAHRGPGCWGETGQVAAMTRNKIATPGAGVSVADADTTRFLTPRWYPWAFRLGSTGGI
jgi:hypothetical protein